MTNSHLERAFETIWIQKTRDLEPALPQLIPQCLFHAERDWPFDFGIPQRLVCIDIQGGGWVRGAHSREGGMRNDCEKHNAALVLGWRPFLVTSSMIEDDPGTVIEQMVELIRQPVLSPNAEYSIWLSLIRNLKHVGESTLNNGITVRREKRNTFALLLSGKEYRTTPQKFLKDGQKEALNLILRGESAASTPAQLQNQSRTRAQRALF